MSEWQMDACRTGINERGDAKPRKIGADTDVVVKELQVRGMSPAGARKSLAEI